MSIGASQPGGYFASQSGNHFHCYCTSEPGTISVLASQETTSKLGIIKFAYCFFVATEKYSAAEVKQFYMEHSMDVFYVIYGSFTTLETTIQDKCK